MAWTWHRQAGAVLGLSWLCLIITRIMTRNLSPIPATSGEQVVVHVTAIVLVCRGFVESHPIDLRTKRGGGAGNSKFTVEKKKVVNLP